MIRLSALAAICISLVAATADSAHAGSPSNITAGNLTWHSNEVGAAHSGDLAYTSGTYQSALKGGSGKASVDKGKYLTIWKKQADGSWKVLFDTFNSDLPASP